jgi:hypothetical protein
MSADRHHIGNLVMMANLRAARHIANDHRLRVPNADESYARGMIHGQNIVARCWLDPEPLLAQAVDNECNFLLTEYLR